MTKNMINDVNAVGTIGISRIAEIGNFSSDTIPVGWVVRERFNEEGKSVSFEYGCHLTEDVFVSVPLHYAFKKSLIPMNNFRTDDHAYYVVPKDIQVAVSMFKNKKDKVSPILIRPNDEYPATLISSFAIDCGPDSIISAKVDSNCGIIRKYIDKDRHSIAIIAFNPEKGLLNPEINIRINKGIIGQNTLNMVSYKFTTGGVFVTTDAITTKNPIETKFIKLHVWDYLDGTKKSSDEVSDNKNFHIENKDDDSE